MKTLEFSHRFRPNQQNVIGSGGTSVAPRERPKGNAAANATSNLGLPIQTSIAPRKRPTPSNPNTPAAPAGMLYSAKYATVSEKQLFVENRVF